METENDVIAEESAELEPTPEEIQEETQDIQEEVKEEKPKLTLEQQRGILQRRLTKINKELGLNEKPADLKTKTDKPTSIDYGHLTFHNSKSDVKITEEADVEYLGQMMAETGKSQKELLGAKWFQAEIKERQEARTVKEAVPSNTRRSQTSARNTVEYWLAKGELPPTSDVQLRRDVLNAKIKIEEHSSKFSDNSIVMG